MFERGQSNGLYLGVIHGVVLRSKPQNVVSNRLGGRGGIQLCFKAVPRVMCAARPLLSLFLSLSVSPSLVHALFCLCGACAGVHVPWLGWCPSPGVRASLATSFLVAFAFLFCASLFLYLSLFLSFFLSPPFFVSLCLFASPRVFACTGISQGYV